MRYMLFILCCFSSLTFALEKNILSIGFFSYSPNERILYSTENELNNKVVTVCINNQYNNSEFKCYDMNGRDFQKTEQGNDGYNLINNQPLVKYNYKKELYDDNDGLFFAFVYGRNEKEKIHFSAQNSSNFTVKYNHLTLKLATCLSTEGLYFYDKNKPNNLKLYYSLGYGVESNCPEYLYSVQ
ncbi:hypothetical protein ABN242_10295 [Providencia alcalifaciens]|uniref:hypothetical protein n=1 Tax=Providencia alcalifaciens TaxID=126385 RepID=UPI00029C61F1|nr:hypothetical protein [Providencia alcalifaciens]EKT65450.1 hypothetical protein OO9_11561 [Providencia alcalifaciens Dmel2]